jgi:hypothetical protein
MDGESPVARLGPSLPRSRVNLTRFGVRCLREGEVGFKIGFNKRPNQPLYQLSQGGPRL